MDGGQGFLRFGVRRQLQRSCLRFESGLRSQAVHIYDVCFCGSLLLRGSAASSVGDGNKWEQGEGVHLLPSM